ncbi:hypothetical protein SCB49_01562 [unidentified eubacterium SCB49]|nr:hypothetical protein SCB49_01562 [unidentified eubacterium SCB49]
MGPGSDLAEKFGHSAFRIKDTENNIDIVYNYGVYDFEAPNFILNFAQGKLLYLLDTGHYQAYKRHYAAHGRWMKEQVLDLNPEEVQTVVAYLQNNARPENRAYLYDFFFDNCATKIRDVLKISLGDELHYEDTYAPQPYTFRQLIQQRLNANSWGSLGIDIALGSVIDKTASPEQHQFLPDYVYEAAKVASTRHVGKTTPLVLQENDLLPERKNSTSFHYLWSPLVVFSLIGFFIIYITVKDNKKQKRSRYLDTILFTITGITGVILLLLWTATDHTATANNYNMLWAMPFNLVMAFVLTKKTPPKWASRYVFLLLVLFCLLCLHWITGVQVFAAALIPLFIALVIRYVYVWRFLK